MSYETQQYVSSLVLNQIKPPNTWWSADFQTITSEGYTFKISKIQSGVQSIIRRCWELYDKITCGRRFATKLPESFKDDLNLDTRGYSFLYHGPFTDHPNSLLKFLCSDESKWKIATIEKGADNTFSIHWHKPALVDLLSLTGELNEHLAVLCYILPAVSTRGTEFFASKYVNDTRMRNLYMMLDEMVHITNYHKMTNQTGLDLCTPAFFPDVLKELMLEYLGGGLRECEVLLSEYAYGPAASLDYSR